MTCVIFAARCYAYARPMPSCGVCVRVARLLTRPAGRVGSDRVGSENLQERAGRVGSGPVRPEA